MPVQNATLHANWRYRRNWRYKLYRTDLQEVSGPIRIKLTRLVSRQIVIFRENFLPPSKMPSRTPMARMFQIYPASHSYFMSIDKPTVALKCFSGNSLSELCLRLFKTFAIVYGRGGTGSGYRSGLRRDYAFFFRMRSQKFLRNRTRMRSHFSVSGVAGVCAVIS